MLEPTPWEAPITLSHRLPVWPEFRRRLRTAVRLRGCQHVGAFDNQQPPLTAEVLASLGLDVESSVRWLAENGTAYCDCEIAENLTEMAHDLQLMEWLDAEQARRDAEPAA